MARTLGANQTLVHQFLTSVGAAITSLLSAAAAFSCASRFDRPAPRNGKFDKDDGYGYGRGYGYAPDGYGYPAYSYSAPSAHELPCARCSIAV